MTLIASFLAGSLLSMLIPAILLIVLVSWYLVFLGQVPEHSEQAPVPNPSPGEGPELSHTSQQLD